MRAGTQAEIGAPLPVPEVVPALEPRLGPVRHLVVVKTRLAEHLARELEHVGLQVSVGRRDDAALHLPPQRGRLLDRQRVRGNVLGLKVDGHA